VCGVSLPAGLHRASQLPETIFTPTTKAHTGHDEPLDFEGMVERLRAFLATTNQTGQDARQLAKHIRERSIEIYEQSARHAESRGIIIADTKFEFGLHGSEVLLVDEVLTPDSSRFWPLEAYRPGAEPPSFDKQYLRDHLEAQHWNKQPPPPPLPQAVVERTQERYEAAYRLLTGREIEYT
jgi:phosphoribosylaminoimidazole-succinocarboxamide synthase